MRNESKSESIIAKKAYSFALDIIKLYKRLITDKKEFVLSKQILRSGTSIGANINEALAGQSKRDFVHKLAIALKESRETSYWLNLLKDSDFITSSDFDLLNSACNEIIKILNSVIITTKEKYFATTKSTNS